MVTPQTGSIPASPSLLDGAGAALPPVAPAVEPAPVVPPPAPLSPPTAAAPVPTALPASDAELVRLRADNTRLIQEGEQRQQQAQQAQIAAELSQSAQQYATYLQNQGWLPEQAQAYAEAQRRAYASDYALAMERKERLADQLAREFGAARSALMAYNSPQEMRAAAQQQGPANNALQKQVQELTQKLDMLTKAMVPPQPYNQPGAGGQSVNTDNIDALFMRWEQQHPDQPNPYEAQYRRFLNM